MKLNVVLFSFFILINCTAFAQNKGFKDFSDFHDSIMRKDYQNRDPKHYLAAFDRFDAEYSKLTDKDKEYFKGNRITALYNLSCTYSLVNDKTHAIAYLKKIY